MRYDHSIDQTRIYDFTVVNAFLDDVIKFSIVLVQAFE